jgi:energy-coupling factor transporter ATP-binding protein EcfA2
MLTLLSLALTGPIATASLPLTPAACITGTSGSGKSTLVRALAHTLGLGDPSGTAPADILLPGHTIRADLSDGRALHMTSAGLLVLTPAEAIPGAPLPRRARLSTAKAILPALTAAGILPPAPPALLRLAFHPGEVIRLATGTPTERRQLSDALAPVMGDPAAALAQALKARGVEGWTGPRTEKDLEPLLKAQRESAERLRGAIGAHEESLRAEPARDPGPAPTSTLAAVAEAWAAFDRAGAGLARWESAEVPDAPDPDLLPTLRARYTVVKAALAEWATYDAAAAKVAAWEAYPMPPLPDQDHLDALTRAHDEAVAAWYTATDLSELWGRAHAEWSEAMATRAGQVLFHNELVATHNRTCEALTAAATCAKCGNVAAVTLPPAPVITPYAPISGPGPCPPEPGPRPQRSPEHEAMLTAEEAHRNAIKARGPKPPVPIAPLTPRPVDTLDAISAQAAAANAAQAAHDAAIKARGARPADPITPTEPRPTPDDVATEADAIDAHRRERATYEADRAARQRTQIVLDRARADLTTAEDAVATTAQVREALRAVPGILAKDAGWRVAIEETIKIDANGATILGRPTGSTGQRIYADAVFRAALLTRLGELGPHMLPLVVDDRLSWSGDLPAYPGQTIALSTSPGPLSALASV